MIPWIAVVFATILWLIAVGMAFYLGSHGWAIFMLIIAAYVWYEIGRSEYEERKPNDADEMFISVKQAALAEVKEMWDEVYPDDPEGDEWFETCGVAAKNLKELAEFCKSAGWDLPTFVRFVLAHSGWNHEDIMMSFYEWDT